MNYQAARVAPEKTVFRPVLPLRSKPGFPEKHMSEFWQKYKDPRWQKLRLQKMEQARFKCEHCEDETSTLNVHHKIYRRSANPWEYELHELECLCEGCHEEHHSLKDQLKEAIAALDQYAFHELLGYAQALALKCACEGSIKTISPMHVEGISAAFASDDYEEVLSLPRTAYAIDLNHLWDLYARRRDQARSNGNAG